MKYAYVIAAYTSAPQVRALHDRLRTIGIEPTSSWAEEAHGPEALEALSTQACRAIWTRNDRDMREADVVIVLADTPCREGFMEAARAYYDGRQDMVWVGRPTLTSRAWVDGCVTVVDVDAAVALLSERAQGAA